MPQPKGGSKTHPAVFQKHISTSIVGLQKWYEMPEEIQRDLDKYLA